jgi:hypothetical protein
MAVLSAENSLIFTVFYIISMGYPGPTPIKTLT